MSESLLPPLEPPPLRRTAILRAISTELNPPVDSIRDISDYCSIYLRKHHKEMVLNKHLKAEEVRQMMDRFSNHARRSLFARRCHTALADYRGRLSQTARDHESVVEESQARLSHFDDDARARLEAMKQRQEEELKRHHAERPEETPLKFKRRSPELLEKFRQERRLFFQSRFDEAAQLRKECAETDAQEATEGYQRALEHWNKNGERLMEKHRKERSAMQHWIELRQMEIKRESGWENEAIGRRKTLLQGQINDKEASLKRSSPHTITRSLEFDKTPPRGTLFTVSDADEIDKLYQQLPEASKRALLKL